MILIDPSKYPYCASAQSYVAGVLDGSILACEWIRLACERHQRDLARVESPDWLYTYNFDLAERAARFATRFPHVKGKWAAKHELFKPEPWQCFWYCSLFGWINKLTGKRRFRKARGYISRKNGKSLMVAPIGLYMLTADGEPGAEVFSGATNEKQAWEVFGPAKQMATLRPDFRDRFGVQVNAKSLTVPGSMAKFEPVIGKPGDGSSPHCSITDEYHEHVTDEQLATMETGMGAREQPLSIVVSTAGDNIAGPCRADWLECQKVLQGTTIDETLFALIFTIDTHPRDVKLQSFSAMKRLEQSCDCHSVAPIQTAQLWAAACAELATRSTGELEVLESALTTLIGMLGADTSAVLATSSTSSTGIQREKLNLSRNEKSGPIKISRGVEPPQNGGTKCTPSGELSLGGNGPTHRSLAESTTGGMQIKEGAAGLAAGTERFSAWIIATLRELFGDFYAENATLASVFLVTLRKLYAAHSNTCCVRSFKFQNDILECKLPAPDWTSVEALQMANPNFGISVSAEFLLAQQRDAINNPRKQGHFKTKHLNIWVQARDAFIDLLKWRSVGDPSLKIEQYLGRKCYLGLDLASKVDLCALELLFPETDGTFVRFGRYYLPRDTVDLPQNQHYREYEAIGLLHVTEGNITDYEEIEADVLEAAKQFEIAGMGYDPHEATMLVTRLVAEGLPMVEFAANVRNFNEPMKQVEALILNKQLRHDGDKVMEWAMSNVLAKVDRGGRLYPYKETNEKKIDPFVALCMAMGLFMTDNNTPDDWSGFIASPVIG